VDPGSLLTMASMRISLSLLKSLRGSNPLLFTNMCESLMALFEVRRVPVMHIRTQNMVIMPSLTYAPVPNPSTHNASVCPQAPTLTYFNPILTPRPQLTPTETLSRINSSRAQRETLQQITDFAASVASTKGPERAYALALIFALGVARGSVSDLLQVSHVPILHLLDKRKFGMPTSGLGPGTLPTHRP
jgi:hypothetical protein